MSIGAVTGGTVLTPAGMRRADLIIRDGKIVALVDAAPNCRQLVDAAGCYILPGGVDPHCHVMADVRAATAAAALGGTTMALSFTNPEAGESDVDCLRRRAAEVGTGGSAVDLGLHAMLYRPGRATFDDLLAARKAGAAAVKVFLAYPELGIMCSTGTLFELMSSAKRLGMIVQVHCEDGALIEALMAQSLSDGRRGARIFADTRPPEAEEAAVAVALAAAALSGADCYLVHLSAAGSVELVRQAKRTGSARVFAEVCLHHLLLDDRGYAGADAERYLVAPPLRSAHHVESLWHALADGTVDTVGSDHCQVRSATVNGLSPSGAGYRYGLAGIGARLPLLLSAGQARGIAIDRLMDVASSNPARIFGHYPGKGAVDVGSDADLVVYDPTGAARLEAGQIADGTDDSVYLGMPLRGRIRAVLLRGQLVASEGRLLAGQRRGRYLPASALELLCNQALASPCDNAGIERAMRVSAAAGPRVTAHPAAHPIRDLVARRASIGAVTLLVVSVVVFAATEVLPGNAAYAILGRSASPARLHALERQLHLNRGLVDQYWTWLSGLFSGHLGTSLANGQSVWTLVEPRLVNSAVLVLVTGLIGTAVGILLGAIAALRKDSWFDHVSSVAALAVTSLPEFVVAITLVIVFATVVWHVLPAVSILPPGTYAWDQPQLLILPVATLVIVIVPYLFRMMRGAMIEALESDYVEMARLKGVPEWRVVLAHAFPNALAPTIQVIGLNFLYLAGGVVVVEYVFNFPGIGQGLVFAVTDRDIPIVQFIVVVLAAFYVLMNILTDVVALLASPRRRIAR